MVGKSILHYEILGEIGAGGMGVVYRARDTKLDREVALKVLPAEMAADPERLARFEREAKAIAALNHPNIVTIHSVERADDTHFITMELVDGTILSEKIPNNGLSIESFFKYAIPIADAVSSAHEKGITHRDLKPANIVIGNDGRVKILDFGLAKLAETVHPEDDATIATGQDATKEGTIVGTAAYMSPEQAEGKEVDQRSDIFSLGVIYYEMVTGERPFRGDTNISTITSILRDQPKSITEIKHTLPRHLGRIIKRCLEKDPRRRYQTALDLKYELEDFKREIDSGELTATGEMPMSDPVRKHQRPWLWVAAAAALIVAVIILSRSFLGLDDEGDQTPTLHFSAVTVQPGTEDYPAISPDGDLLAYQKAERNDTDIYLQRVGGSKPINLTEGYTGFDGHPAFSPDGQSIAFTSERSGGGIFVMGATGESVRKVSDMGAYPTWSPDGKKLAFCTEAFAQPRGRTTTSQLWVLDLVTSESKKIYDGDAVQPDWSPGGHRIAYWNVNDETGGVRDIWTIRVDGMDPVRVTNDKALDWNPVWSADGKYLYFVSNRGGSDNLWRVRINERSGRTDGEFQPITTPATWMGSVAISRDPERLVFVNIDVRSHIDRVACAPIRGVVTGKLEPVLQGSLIAFEPEVSPDGERVAFQSSGRQEDIYLIRSDGSDLRKLTDDPDRDRGVSWAPDGSEIYFYSDRSGRYEFWSIRPDGSNLKQMTRSTGNSFWYPTWRPDGTRLMGTNEDGVTLFDMTEVPFPTEKGERLPPIPESNGFLYAPVWSPDGMRLAGAAFDEDFNPLPGLWIYDFTTKAYESFDLEEKVNPRAWWLADNARVVAGVDQSLFLVDTRSGRVRVILEGLPVGDGSLPISMPDDRSAIYLNTGVTQADVWLGEFQ